MEEKTCAMCAHYFQHYTLTERGLVGVCCGHCGVSVQRKPTPDRKSCDDFLPGGKDRKELFASKQYLTKKLLQHVLDMELLPEIAER